jgi:hypothetical protein
MEASLCEETNGFSHGRLKEASVRRMHEPMGGKGLPKSEECRPKPVSESACWWAIDVRSVSDLLVKHMS